MYWFANDGIVVVSFKIAFLRALSKYLSIAFSNIEPYVRPNVNQMIQILTSYKHMIRVMGLIYRSNNKFCFGLVGKKFRRILKSRTESFHHCGP